MSESARGVRNKIFSLGLLLFVLPIISFGQSNSDTSRLGSEDRQSIESACSYEKLALGPAVYHQCVQKQLNAVGGSRSPDLSNLTQEDRQSIESACSYEKLALGPAVYHQCVQKQLNALGGSRSPDLSNLTQEDRQSIESACSYEK